MWEMMAHTTACGRDLSEETYREFAGLPMKVRELKDLVPMLTVQAIYILPIQ